MRILALADVVSPVVYSSNFPGNLKTFDLTLAAGDLPGNYLEFVATRTDTPPLFVFGNHPLEYLQNEDGELLPPGGCIDAHLKLVQAGGLMHPRRRGQRALQGWSAPVLRGGVRVHARQAVAAPVVVGAAPRPRRRRAADARASLRTACWQRLATPRRTGVQRLPPQVAPAAACMGTCT